MQAFNSALLFGPSPYLALLFLKNSLLSLLFGQNLLQAVKRIAFFLARFACSVFIKHRSIFQEQLDHKVYKYFGFNLSAFLEASFWHFLSIMVLKCCSNVTLSNRHYIGSKTMVNFQYTKNNQYCIIYILQFD